MSKKRKRIRLPPSALAISSNTAKEEERERGIRVFFGGAASEDDRGGAERPAGEEGEGEVQRGRYHRRPQEAGGRPDRHPRRQDPNPEVVQHLQGPHHPQGLRGPRRHGPRALLQLISLPLSSSSPCPSLLRSINHMEILGTGGLGMPKSCSLVPYTTFAWTVHLYCH
ncbi:hypothetical protein EUGRSUZ_J00886 [Eucalyptus grandis]|uniref:Uncharacterized protein n=2 Tax=Eucalyptus grandis TaxID=71139 RepID=A0ACC3J518_EUCGR|nr:hypothetical protein EUGRSUZ_J00886 [Eucalyptus grandis]